MGSDMAMESRNFSPGANRAEWMMVDGELELVLSRDVFYHGYATFWHGPVTDSNRELILTMVNNIPSKPVIKEDRDYVLANLLVNKWRAKPDEVNNLVKDIVEIFEDDYTNDIPVFKE